MKESMVFTANKCEEQRIQFHFNRKGYGYECVKNLVFYCFSSEYEEI